MIDTKPSYNPNYAVHPGATLADELEFLNLSQVSLAQRTGLSEKHISQIVNGESPITPETAIKLEYVTKVSAEFWNARQKSYDLTVARLAAEARVEKEIPLAKKFLCYAELVVLKSVAATRDWGEKTQELLKYFGVDSLAYVPETEQFAFRQSKGKFDEYSLAAWLRYGELEAQKIQTQPFDKARVRALVPELKKLTRHPSDFGQKLQELCASVGIAVVYAPYFKGTKVNGASWWRGDKAVIALNTKGSYSDIFWFTFFHELGHILLHGVKGKFIDYEGKHKDAKENEADTFASNTLIPRKAYEAFIANRPLTTLGIDVFAKSNDVGQSIVVGRIAHEGVVPWQSVSRMRTRLLITPD